MKVSSCRAPNLLLFNLLFNHSEKAMATQTDKHAYRFGPGEGEGGKSIKALLGGKGANLNEMSLARGPGSVASTLAAAHRTLR